MNLPRPELQHFADKLRREMTAANVSNSELARRMNGTIKDNRGYDVARGRDRIGAYLAGTSYPKPENLQKIADALGIPVEKLKIDRPDPGSHPARAVIEESNLHISAVYGQPDKVRVQVDHVLSRQAAIKIVQVIYEDNPTVNASGTNLANRLANDGKLGPE